MILRIIISSVFLVAGFLKLLDPAATADGMSTFRILPVWTIAPLALGIPFFEILITIGMWCSRTRAAASLAACGLSVCFVLLYGSAWVSGLDVSCSCFGKWEILQVSTQVGLIRAAVLLALCLWNLRQQTLKPPA